MRMTGGLRSDHLTREQFKKLNLAEESIDSRGSSVRLKVQDQTLFDALFVADLIGRPLHEAANCFMESLEKSGAFPASVNLAPSFRLPAYAVGDAMGARRMVFSRAYRFMLRECGKVDADYLMGLMSDCYSWRERIKRSNLPYISSRLVNSLKSLSKFYGCFDQGDPRDIIRHQYK